MRPAVWPPWSQRLRASGGTGVCHAKRYGQVPSLPPPSSRLAWRVLRAVALTSTAAFAWSHFNDWRDKRRARADVHRTVWEAWAGVAVHPLGGYGRALAEALSGVGDTGAALPVGPPPYLFTDEDACAAYVATGTPPWVASRDRLGGEAPLDVSPSQMASSRLPGGRMRYLSFHIGGGRRVDVAVFRALNEYTGRQSEAGTPACPVLINAGSIAAARPLALELCLRHGCTVIAYTHAGLTLPLPHTAGDEGAVRVLQGEGGGGEGAVLDRVQEMGLGQASLLLGTPSPSLSPHTAMSRDGVDSDGSSRGGWYMASLLAELKRGVGMALLTVRSGDPAPTHSAALLPRQDFGLRVRGEGEGEGPADIGPAHPAAGPAWGMSAHRGWRDSVAGPDHMCTPRDWGCEGEAVRPGLPTPEWEAAELAAVLRYCGIPRAVLVSTGPNWAATALAARRNGANCAGLVLVDPLTPSSVTRTWHPSLPALFMQAAMEVGAREGLGTPTPTPTPISASAAEDVLTRVLMAHSGQGVGRTDTPRLPPFGRTLVGHWAGMLGPHTPPSALLALSQCGQARSSTPPALASAGEGVGAHAVKDIPHPYLGAGLAPLLAPVRPGGPSPIVLAQEGSALLAREGGRLLASPGTLCVLDGEGLACAAYAKAAAGGSALGHTGCLPSWTLVQASRMGGWGYVLPRGVVEGRGVGGWEGGALNSLLRAIGGGGGGAHAEGGAPLSDASSPPPTHPLPPLSMVWCNPLEVAALWGPTLDTHRLTGGVSAARAAAMPPLTGLVVHPAAPPSLAQDTVQALTRTLHPALTTPAVFTGGAELSVYEAARKRAVAMEAGTSYAPTPDTDTRTEYVQAQLEALRVRAWGQELLEQARGVWGGVGREALYLPLQAFAVSHFLPRVRELAGGTAVGQREGDGFTRVALLFTVVQGGGSGAARGEQDDTPAPAVVRSLCLSIMARAAAEARVGAADKTGVGGGGWEGRVQAEAAAIEAAAASLMSGDGTPPSGGGTLSAALGEYTSAVCLCASPASSALAPHAWSPTLPNLLSWSALLATACPSTLLSSGSRGMAGGGSQGKEMAGLASLLTRAHLGALVREVEGARGEGIDHAAVCRMLAQAGLARSAAPITLSAPMEGGYAAWARELMGGGEGVRVWQEAVRTVQGAGVREGTHPPTSSWLTWPWVKVVGTGVGVDDHDPVLDAVLGQTERTGPPSVHLPYPISVLCSADSAASALTLRHGGQAQGAQGHTPEAGRSLHDPLGDIVWGGPSLLIDLDEGAVSRWGQLLDPPLRPSLALSHAHLPHVSVSAGPENDEGMPGVDPPSVPSVLSLALSSHRSKSISFWSDVFYKRPTLRSVRSDHTSSAAAEGAGDAFKGLSSYIRSVTGGVVCLLPTEGPAAVDSALGRVEESLAREMAPGPGRGEGEGREGVQAGRGGGPKRFRHFEASVFAAVRYGDPGAYFALSPRDWEALPLARAAGLSQALEASAAGMSGRDMARACAAGLIPEAPGGPTTGEPGEPYTDLADAVAYGPPQPYRPALYAVARAVADTVRVESDRRALALRG